MKVKMVIELEYDEKIMHGTDAEAIEWFYGTVLHDSYARLFLHSHEIGDMIGSVRVLNIENPYNKAIQPTA